MKSTKSRTKKDTRLDTTTRALEKAQKEIVDLKENVDLASSIMFYLLKENNDGSHKDDFKTVFHKYLPKEFDTKPVDGFHWELDRDVLAQRFVVAAGCVSLIKELPSPTMEMSPVYGKG